MRIGAKLPNNGPLPLERGIPALARALEHAGVDSIWVSDHVVLPRTMDSPYPFAADGRATWPSDMPYIEPLIALALAAAATERVRLGTAVLVLPQRNPVLFAKQCASIDVASGGRLELGLGAGWLEREFEALDAPFARRGARLAEWIEISRDCWTGAPAARNSADYTLPPEILCLPTPAHEIPILLGGHSPRALARTGAIADGWLPQQTAGEFDPAALASQRAVIAAAARDAGRQPESLRTVLRIIGSAGRTQLVADALPALAEAGVDEVVVDLSWENDDQVGQVATLSAATVGS
ncbi:MAG TPA: TIGR03619 family F420-dependent LLM class oxidoreductase [Solirubrobacteraceae bacterium]